MARIPASEIIRDAEDKLRKAVEMRLEALRIEENAKSDLVSLLGAINGTAAYEIALWSLKDAEMPTVSVAVEPEVIRAVTKPVEAPETIEQPKLALSPASSISHASIARPTEVAKLADNSKSVLHGVDIPPSRMAEAEEIVIQAKSFNSQGRKSNPFANDRGKNAWRKTLFNAVLLVNDGAAPEINREIPEEDSTEINPNSENEIASENEPRSLEKPAFAENIEDTFGNTFTEGEIGDDEDSSNSLESEDLSALGTVEELDGNAEQEVPDELIDDDPYADLDPSAQDPDDARIEAFYQERDPFEDELPPVSKLPPPRGYPEGADTGDDEPAPVPVEASKPETSPSSMGFTRPSPLGAPTKPQTKQDAAPTVDNAAKITPHQPMPIPPNRRPGNGQVLQSPTTLPSSILGGPMAKAGDKPTSALGRPPAFMMKKG